MPPANDFTVGDGLNVTGHRWNRRIDGQMGGNSVGNDNNRRQLNTRVDYQLNNDNKVSFSMSREKDDSTQIRDWPSGFERYGELLPARFRDRYI